MSKFISMSESCWVQITLLHLLSDSLCVFVKGFEKLDMRRAKWAARLKHYVKHMKSQRPDTVSERRVWWFPGTSGRMAAEYLFLKKRRGEKAGVG